MAIGINKYTDTKMLYTDFCKVFIKNLKTFLEKQNYVTVVLCGGKTPLNLYPYLVKSIEEQNVDLSKVYFFFGDERFVCPTENISNCYNAQKEFFSKVKVSCENIFPMVTDWEKDIQNNKNAYKAIIEDFFKRQRSDNIFDIVLLGIGSDGHIASLFSDDKNILSGDIVRAINSKYANPKVPRLTLGLDIINSSRKILLLTDSLEKEQIVKTVLTQNNNIHYPASFINKEKVDFFFITSK